jgi:hypothetical protein
VHSCDAAIKSREHVEAGGAGGGRLPIGPQPDGGGVAAPGGRPGRGDAARRAARVQTR